jgi:hypothetical protein
MSIMLMMVVLALVAVPILLVGSWEVGGRCRHLSSRVFLNRSPFDVE